MDKQGLKCIIFVYVSHNISPYVRKSRGCNMLVQEILKCPCKMSSHQVLAQAVAQFRSDLKPLTCFHPILISTSLKLICFSRTQGQRQTSLPLLKSFIPKKPRRSSCCHDQNPGYISKYAHLNISKYKFMYNVYMQLQRSIVCLFAMYKYIYIYMNIHLL